MAKSKAGDAFNAKKSLGTNDNLAAQQKQGILESTWHGK
jgi:hypothetical protein